MEYLNWRSDPDDGAGGVVQIVELSDDRCHVGYLPDATGKWQHWGTGTGGYKATCKRFLKTTRQGG